MNNTMEEVVENFDAEVHAGDEELVENLFNSLSSNEQILLAVKTNSEETLEALTELAEYQNMTGFDYDIYAGSLDEFAEVREAIVRNKNTSPKTLERLSEYEENVSVLGALVENDNTPPYALMNATTCTTQELYEDRAVAIYKHPNFDEESFRKVFKSVTRWGINISFNEDDYDLFLETARYYL